MKIWVSPYELKPVHAFDAVAVSLKGLLLKFDDEKYSLYHPIEKLKDQPLGVFLKNLSLENPVFKRVFEARVSLEDFEGASDKSVSSYYSAPSFDVLKNCAADIFTRDFNTVKLKLSSFLKLQEKIEILKGLEFKYILDLNGRGAPEELSSLSDEVADFLSKRVLYVEDPFAHYFDDVKFKVASDFVNYQGQEDFQVLKPTGFNHSLNLVDRDSSIVTSYLDHPFGQLLAAKYALDNAVSNDCGLMSHVYFKEDQYSEALGLGGELKLSSAGDIFKELSKEHWSLI